MRTLKALLTAAALLAGGCTANREATTGSSGVEDPAHARARSILDSAGGSRHGEHTAKFLAENGTVVAEGSLDDCRPVGRWLFRNDQGLPVACGSFRDGQLTGVWFLWSPEGDLATDRRLLDEHHGSRLSNYPIGAEWFPSEDAGRTLLQTGYSMFDLWCVLLPIDWRGAGVYENGEFVRELEPSEREIGNALFLSLKQEGSAPSALPETERR